jgi:hypothetical protein
MTNQFTHIADVKVGRVKGNSRIYPQFRLPSQYAELAGKKASIYELSGHEEDIAFIIRFDSQNHMAAHRGDVQAEMHCVASKFQIQEYNLNKTCRGSDSGSNPDSGALFFALFWSIEASHSS